MYKFFTVATVLAIAITGNTQTVSLGTAGTYGVLGGADVTNTGVTTVDGSVGVYPGTSITGFPPGVATGVYSYGDPAAAAAQADAATAYGEATGLPCGTDLTGQDLGGMVLLPGVYCFATSATLTGVLTLDGNGATNPLFVFQIGTVLTTATGSEVTLINGAVSCGIYWAVGSSTTLGTGTVFSGNIIAMASISVDTDVTSDGGLYALTGGVTLIMDTISAVGSCNTVTTTTSTTTTSSTTTSTTSTTTSTTSSTTTTTSSTTSTTSSPTSTTTSTTLSCTADNCLRAFDATQTPGRLQTAQAYCSAYTKTTSHSSTPTWVPAECTASRISSVCSCIATFTAPTTSSTPSTTTSSTTSTTTSSTTSTTTSSTSTSTTTSSTSTSTTTSSSTSTTTPTTMLACTSDNCLRAFDATQTPGRLQSAQAYCSAYTKTTSHSSTPTWVPAECTPSRISSVCSCIATSTPTMTS